MELFTKRHRRRLATAYCQQRVFPTEKALQQEELQPISAPEFPSGEPEWHPEDVEFNNMFQEKESDEEDELCDENLTEVGNFLDGLRLWVVEFSQTVCAVDKLLAMINERLPSIRGVPKTHKTLMRTPTTSVPLRDVVPGQCAHYGIQNFMWTLTDESVLAKEEIVIDIGIDGASLANSSGLQAWPIIGFIVGTNVTVFDIGIYVGMKKPDSACIFLLDYAREKFFIEANGVFVSPGKILKSFRVRVISADAPARSFFSGNRYFNHFKGCTKCDQTCFSVGRRRIYSTTVGNLRTDESFAARADPLHHARE